MILSDITNKTPVSDNGAVTKRKLHIFDLSVFFQTQLFLMPFLLLFYQSCGLTVGDFFLFQGIFSLSGLLLEIPMGYLGDIFPKRNILILSYTFFILRLLLWLFFAHYGYWIILTGEILYAAQKTTFTGVSESYIYEYLKYYNIPQEMAKHYGHMNFFLSLGTAFSVFISTPIYSIVSKYTSAQYGHNYAFIVLLSLELMLNLTAVCLLFKLPKIPQAHPPLRDSLKQSYQKLFHSIAWTVQNKNIRYHVFYSGLLTAVTLVFAWSFQPIMKLLLFPVSLFGVVYFMNHIFRALAGFYLDKIKHLISLSKMSVLTFVLFVVGFILTFAILKIHALPYYWSLLYFAFISFAIGIQWAFRLLHNCRLFLFIPSDMRATLASVNSAIGRLYGAFFFVLMKILLDGVSIRDTFLICFVIFIVFSLPLKAVYSIQSQEDAHVKK